MEDEQMRAEGQSRPFEHQRGSRERGAERGDPLPLPRDEAGGGVPTEGRPLYKRQRFQRDFTSAGHVIVMTWESTVAWGHSEQCRNSPDKQTVRCLRDPVEMKMSRGCWSTRSCRLGLRACSSSEWLSVEDQRDDLETEEPPEESWQFRVQQPGWESQPWD